MCAPPVHHRLPRAGIDRIDRPETAIITMAMAIHRPLRPETITVLLDHERRGVAIAVVSDTRQPDAVLEVVECLTRTSAHGGRVGAIVVATVRPGVPDPVIAHGDVDRWLEMSDIAEQAGVELLEWFVINGDVTCPRDRLGEPPRW
jgi:hypothetical protein